MAAVLNRIMQLRVLCTASQQWHEDINEPKRKLLGR
jgi:hypothetical protein